MTHHVPRSGGMVSRPETSFPGPCSLSAAEAAVPLALSQDPGVAAGANQMAVPEISAQALLPVMPQPG